MKGHYQRLSECIEARMGARGYALDQKEGFSWL